MSRPTERGSLDDERNEGERLKLAGFRVGDGLYGVDIMRIKEVIQSGPYPVRPVPHAPSIVEGVIQLRGVVIPVIDLRKRFGSSLDSVEPRLNKLIIVSVRGRIVGLKVDRILGELRLTADALRPAPSMLRPTGDEQSDFFTGVCRLDDDMVFVIKLETVIDPRVGSLPPEASPPNAAGPAAMADPGHDAPVREEVS